MPRHSCRGWNGCETGATPTRTRLRGASCSSTGRPSSSVRSFPIPTRRRLSSAGVPERPHRDGVSAAGTGLLPKRGLKRSSTRLPVSEVRPTAGLHTHPTPELVVRAVRTILSCRLMELKMLVPLDGKKRSAEWGPPTVPNRCDPRRPSQTSVHLT